jgi:hypothetical protein
MKTTTASNEEPRTRNEEHSHLPASAIIPNTPSLHHSMRPIGLTLPRHEAQVRPLRAQQFGHLRPSHLPPPRAPHRINMTPKLFTQTPLFTFYVLRYTFHASTFRSTATQDGARITHHAPPVRPLSLFLALFRHNYFLFFCHLPCAISQSSILRQRITPDVLRPLYALTRERN